MAYSWTLQGSIVVNPLLGVDSGISFGSTPLDENVQLLNKVDAQYVLTDDAAHGVSLGGLTDVSVLTVKVIGSKVRVRITSADGTTQAIPVDSLLILTDLSVPITAIDLTRQLAGVDTTVIVFLGERA